MVLINGDPDAEDIFGMSLLPEDNTAEPQIISFPRLKDVPSTWGTMYEDLSEYFWKNCSYGGKNYGFPRKGDENFEESMIKFVQKSGLGKYGDEGYDFPELPTSRRYFKLESLDIGEEQRPGWSEFGSVDNFEFFPPDHKEVEQEVNSDVAIFSKMSTDDLVELHWDRLSHQKEDDSDWTSQSEDENSQEDMSEIDAYLDYHTAVNIPERIPRLMMTFRKDGSCCSYKTSEPKARNQRNQKKPAKSSIFSKLFILIYCFIASFFKKEDERKQAPKREPSTPLEITISTTSRDVFTCQLSKTWSIIHQKIICWGQIYCKTNDKPIVITCTDGKNKKISFNTLGQNDVNQTTPETINIKVNFPLDKLHISSEENSVVHFKVEGKTGREVKVKFTTDAGDVIFDKTVISRATPEVMLCKVVKSFEEEDVEVVQPEELKTKVEKTWIDDLPKELDLKLDSKLIEVFCRNRLDLLKVNCSCTIEQNPAILLKIPGQNDISYKICDLSNTITKTMHYSFGKYSLQDSNPSSTIDIDITLRNLDLDNFEHSWERHKKVFPIPENILVIKPKENVSKIKVLFKDELGNYKIDDFASPLQIEDQDHRKRLIVMLKNTLYKMSGTFSLTCKPPYVLTCQIHHTLYEMIEPIRVTINDGKNFKEFSIVDESNDIGVIPFVKLIDIELRNGLVMSDISTSAVTTRINKTKNSTLKITFSPNLRPPIVVDVIDDKSGDRYVIEKTSKVNLDVFKVLKDLNVFKDPKIFKCTIKTIYVLMKDGLSLDNVHFLATKPSEVDGVWHNTYIISVSEETTDDLVVWLVGAKEIKKMTINRKESKHSINQEILEKPESIITKSSQANLIILLKRIPLANTDIIIKQYDKNSSNSSIILTVLTKEQVPIKMITRVEEQTPEAHFFFSPQPKITPSLEVRIIKGLYLRDLEITTVDRQDNGQDVLVKVQNPRGHWLVMSINDSDDRHILKIYSDRADKEAKEIRLVISDDLMSSIVSHFWVKPTVLEEAMIFKITFGYGGKIDIKTFPVVYNIENVVDDRKLVEQNLKVVDKLSKLHDFAEEEKEVPEAMKETSGVSSDDSGVDLYDRYFKGDADFYKRLYGIFEGWKHELMIKDSDEDEAIHVKIGGEEQKAVPRKYRRGLPMVGFLMPLLTFSGQSEKKTSLPYQRCDLAYAKYLSEYYKRGHKGDEFEYIDYSTGEEEDLELEEAAQHHHEKHEEYQGKSKEAQDDSEPEFLLFVPSVYPSTSTYPCRKESSV